MPQELNRERANDLVDLEGRLLREMAGVKTTALEMMPSGRVLVAHRQLPSETVAQIQNATKRIADGQQLIVGEVILSPDPAVRARFEEKIRSLQGRLLRAKRLVNQPARTVDGTQVAVMANLGCREDVSAAAENGADGVGLYRIEQFYLSRNTPPSAGELLAELREAFAPLAGKPITVRLLDLGADKPVPYINFPIEDEPFLGCRGARLLLRYPDLLDIQFRALLDFSCDHDLHILVPMVSLAEDMAEIRKRFRAIANCAGFGKLPSLGAMIDAPAAALTVGDIIRHADFVSIGTNDLTQFMMAAGRENPMVNHYFVEIHPTVLRLVQIVVEEAGKTPVAICGELASQLDSIPTLPKLVPLTHSKRQRSADHIPLPTALRGSPDNSDSTVVAPSRPRAYSDILPTTPDV